MIPTSKFKPKHLRIKGTSRARKTDKNSSKKTRKSNELQTPNRRNHESFHSLGGQILYKERKILTLESKEMRSSPSSQVYLSLHSLEAPQGIDLSHPLFTCTNANQAATCICNTQPRVSPHHFVNHLSQPGATIHRSSDAPVLNLPLDECIDNTQVTNSEKREKETKTK
jgi:hypothetical protein